MDAIHDDIDARAEPLAALTASEGGIYERFGYGIATRRRVATIDRRRAVLAERFRPPPGSVRLVDATSSLGEIRAVWDRYRSTRAGEIDRDERWHEAAFAREPKTVHALHADGYASWTFDSTWNDGHPAARAVRDDDGPGDGRGPRRALADRAGDRSRRPRQVVRHGARRPAAVPPHRPAPRAHDRAQRQRVVQRRATSPRASGRAPTAPTTTSSSRSTARGGASARPGCPRVRIRARPRDRRRRPRRPAARRRRPDDARRRPARRGARRRRRCAAPTPCSSSTRPRTARPASDIWADRPGGIVAGSGANPPRWWNRAAGSLAAVSDRITTADVVHVARLARLALSTGGDRAHDRRSSAPCSTTSPTSTTSTSPTSRR